jgi:DNA-binding CsgD family transcriptional regulator
MTILPTWKRPGSCGAERSCLSRIAGSRVASRGDTCARGAISRVLEVPGESRSIYADYVLVPTKGLRATRLASGAVVLSYDLETIATERLAAFPPAEREVVQKMLDGLADDEIASERGCSVHTVSNLLRSAYRRVGATSRWELTALLTQPPDGEVTK